MVLQIWRLRAHCAQGDMNVCCFGCFCPLLLAAQTNQRAGLDSYPFCLAAGVAQIAFQAYAYINPGPAAEH